MRRTLAYASALLLASCGGVVVSGGHADGPREALVDALCAPLPSRAYDCVVGWPASVAPARRAAVLGASEGAVWASSAGVRAFASCADRPASDGPVAHVVVIAIDTSVATAEDIAERLPVRVRWDEACEGETDACASYLARVDGDRLVLTRRVPRPWNTSENVAHLACAAVRDGAEEAHARVDEEDALVRELRVEQTGVALVTRRPGGRGGAERTYRTWTELELGVLDERIEHEATVRVAASARPLDPEEIDVAHTELLDQQIHARVRRLARGQTPDGLHDLARLAERGFAAHPSRPDLGVLAVESYVRAGEPAPARTVLDGLRAVIGFDAADVTRLELLTAVAARDTEALAHALAAMAPDLATSELAAVASALVDQLGTHLEDEGVVARVSDAARAFAFGVRAAHVTFRHRSAGTVTPAYGAAWAIRAMAGGAGSGLVAVCGTRAIPSSVTQLSSSRGGTITVATMGTCGVALLDPSMRFELGTAAQGMLTAITGDVRVLLELDGRVVGLSGEVGSDHALHVDGATPELARADLARAQRLVVAPLSAIGAQVFPAPTLRIPMSGEESAAALRTLSANETVYCERRADTLACHLESGEPVDRFVDVTEALYRAE